LFIAGADLTGKRQNPKASEIFDAGSVTYGIDLRYEREKALSFLWVRVTVLVIGRLANFLIPAAVVVVSPSVERKEPSAELTFNASTAFYCLDPIVFLHKTFAVRVVLWGVAPNPTRERGSLDPVLTRRVIVFQTNSPTA